MLETKCGRWRLAGGTCRTGTSPFRNNACSFSRSSTRILMIRFWFSRNSSAISGCPCRTDGSSRIQAIRCSRILSRDSVNCARNFFLCPRLSNAKPSCAERSALFSFAERVRIASHKLRWVLRSFENSVRQVIVLFSSAVAGAAVEDQFRRLHDIRQSFVRCLGGRFPLDGSFAPACHFQNSFKIRVRLFHFLFPSDNLRV